MQAMRFYISEIKGENEVLKSETERMITEAEEEKLKKSDSSEEKEL